MSGLTMVRQITKILFSASTHRWKVPNDKLSSRNLPTLKRMSDTRWSARADATKALVDGYDEICDALVELADDVDQKADVREEASGYADNMNRLETGILAVLWYHILIHGSSQILQRNRRYDDPEAAREQLQTPVNKFRTGTFLVIVDSIASELQKRLGAYSEIAAKFGFLRTLEDLPNEQVIECAINLQNANPEDLEDSLSDELLQFSTFLNTDFAKKSLQATASPTIPSTSSVPMPESETSSDESANEETESVAVVTKDYDDVLLGVESMEFRLYHLIVANNLETVFPNTAIYFACI